MRSKMIMAALGLGLAASFAPLPSASAVCSAVYEELTGECNPCDAINRFLVRHGLRPLDCIE
jgi:hypothetical protein